jgi:BMFP domain-containing protein YqiC
MGLIIAFLVISVLGLLYLDRAILLEDAKNLQKEVADEIEKVTSEVEAGTKAKISSALDKLKAKL